MDRHVIAMVRGIVQGIGFRPFCSTLAARTGLGGSVQNTSSGVRLELYGSPDAVDLFLQRLRADCPTLGHIQSIELVLDEEIQIEHEIPFSILDSEQGEENHVLIPPDIATCEDCLLEMRDPQDRRYRYPFINCTNCGPRFSIITGLPYDRPFTTMSIFPLCEQCRSEYGDKKDRRYHAQPLACKKCGPLLSLLDPDGSTIATGAEAIDACVGFLSGGSIVAIKGIGGFHIACLPEDITINELRTRKKRPHKPLALMVRDESAADRIIRLSPSSRLMLKSPRRPIVVCPKREGSGISDLVAPFQDSIGIMLPYTPIHHLILEKLPVLVMTSANLAEAPIISDNSESLGSLAGIADKFLIHDREIKMKIDDSVLSFAGKRPIVLRRGRGFVPHPLLVEKEMPQILATGSEMRSTFSITRERMIFAGQYLGDLKQMDTAVYYAEALKHFISLFGFRPRLLAADMHPLYPGIEIAKKVIGEPEETLLIQHHHAHLGACLAENNYFGRAIGIILDGTGLGTDRTTWGGEILVGDLRSFKRAGHFMAAPLPGGDRSVLEPWRFALSLLVRTFGKKEASEIAFKLWPEKTPKVSSVIMTLDHAPITTSCGRLFDAVSAILGIRTTITYDGQAAMELESASKGAGIETPFKIVFGEDSIILDWRPAIKWIVEDGLILGKGRASAAFHRGLTKNLCDIALEISNRTGLKKVALSGGVWQNRLLLSLAVAMLRFRGLDPLVHQSLSPNDECVSVGQAIIAAEHWRDLI